MTNYIPVLLYKCLNYKTNPKIGIRKDDVDTCFEYGDINGLVPIYSLWKLLKSSKENCIPLCFKAKLVMSWVTPANSHYPHFAIVAKKKKKVNGFFTHI